MTIAVDAAVPFGVTELGAILQFSPAMSDAVQVREVAALKPLVGVTVRVVVAEPPGAEIVLVADESAIVKLGTGGAVMVTAKGLEVEGEKIRLVPEAP